MARLGHCHDMQEPNWVDWAELKAIISPGSRIYIPGSSGEPTAFLDKLAEMPHQARDIEIVTTFLPGLNTYDLAAIHPELRLTAFFPLPCLADAAARSRILPLSYYEIAAYLERCEPDLAVLQVSNPDKDGRCSFGPWSEFARSAMKAARQTIGIVNPNVRAVCDGPRADLGEFDFLLAANRPVHEHVPVGEDDRASVIAHLVASLVENGATLQTGIGKLPSLVLEALTNHRELGMHTGIVLPALRTLIESGSIAGKGRVVTASALGDAGFYQWISGREEIKFVEVAETHAAAAIMACDRFTAINSALEVDLQGQCNAESVAGRAVSGPGGLPDFTFAARRSLGGKSIIALPSTDAKRRFSRIVPELANCAPVSIGRHGVDFVVTEHGIADLRDKAAHERAAALISIADPAFQPALLKAIS